MKESHSNSHSHSLDESGIGKCPLMHRPTIASAIGGNRVISSGEKRNLTN